MILIFKDQNWTIATSCWTLGSHTKQKTVLIYTWDSVWNTRTGVHRVTIYMPLQDLLHKIRERNQLGVCDITDLF